MISPDRNAGAADALVPAFLLPYHDPAYSLTPSVSFSENEEETLVQP
ncbi:MAG: hypothetical protein GDA51_06080 [Ekhidna sp.]|nr:hypothetical protein [Ekhidna sp.]